MGKEANPRTSRFPVYLGVPLRMRYHRWWRQLAIMRICGEARVPKPEAWRVDPSNALASRRPGALLDPWGTRRGRKRAWSIHLGRGTQNEQPSTRLEASSERARPER